MLYLSKSKYCGLWQCPKIAWLKKYKPEKLAFDESTLSRMEAGNEVGDLAMGLFGDFVEVTAYHGDKLDLPQMIAATKAEMEKGTPVICEASFQYNGLYCAVDILKKENGGWAIYEVKSSTHNDQPVYIADVAYQKYVLEHCGVPVSGLYLVCLDDDYVFDGCLDIHRLFKITDVAQAAQVEANSIAANLSIAERLLASEEEPAIDLSVNCKNPYLCGFWPYCSRHIPSPSVFDLYRMPFAKKIEYYGAEDILHVCMKRQLLSDPNRSMTVCLNNRLEVMDIDAFHSPLTEREQELLGAFEGMWFAFPTPFKRGDLVCQKHSLKAWRFPQNACYVLESIAAWTNREMQENGFWGNRSDTQDMDRLHQMLLKDGDVTDMSFSAYSVEDGQIIFDNVGWYLSLERFNGTLTGEQRALYPLRDLLNGKIRPDMFLDALRVLRADEETKNTAGIRENLLYHKDMSYISAENAEEEACEKEETL